MCDELLLVDLQLLYLLEQEGLSLIFIYTLHHHREIQADMSVRHQSSCQRQLEGRAQGYPHNVYFVYSRAAQQPFQATGEVKSDRKDLHMCSLKLAQQHCKLMRPAVVTHTQPERLR